MDEQMVGTFHDPSGKGLAKIYEVSASPCVYRVNLVVFDRAPKSVNCYIVRQGGETLLVDTGHASEAGERLLMRVLRQCEVDVERASLFLTHLHADHAGLFESVLPPDCPRYVSSTDRLVADELAEGAFTAYGARLRQEGLPEKFLQPYEAIFEPWENGGASRVRMESLDHGGHVPLGPLDDRVCAMPGHTPGHHGLFMPEAGLLFSGDHVLMRVTPHLGFWPTCTSGLRAFFDEASRLQEVPVRWALPGHEGPLPATTFLARLWELERHHRARLNDIRNVLRMQREALSAFDLVRRIPWSGRPRGFENLRDIQVFLAQNGMLLYLEYLTDRGEVTRTVVGGAPRYRLA